MGQWSREELEEAFHNYQQAVVRIAKRGTGRAMPTSSPKTQPTSSTHSAASAVASRSGNGSRRR